MRELGNFSEVNNMGNNEAGTLLERFLMACAKRGALTPELISDLGKVTRDLDWDSGGFEGLRNKDDHDVHEVVLQIVGRLPKRPDNLPADSHKRTAAQEKAWEAYIDLVHRRFSSIFHR